MRWISIALCVSLAACASPRPETGPGLPPLQAPRIEVWPTTMSPGTRLWVNVEGLTAEEPVTVKLGNQTLPIVEREPGRVVVAGLKAGTNSAPHRLVVYARNQTFPGPEVLTAPRGFQAPGASAMPDAPSYLTWHTDKTLVVSDGARLFRIDERVVQPIVLPERVLEIRGLATLPSGVVTVLARVSAPATSRRVTEVLEWSPGGPVRTRTTLYADGGGLTVDDAGQLFTVDRHSGDVLRIGDDGRATWVASVPEIGAVVDLAVVGEDLFLVATPGQPSAGSQTGGTLYRMPVVGGSPQVVSMGFAQAGGIAPAPDGQLAVIWEMGSFGCGAYWLDPATEAQTAIVTYPRDGPLAGIGDVAVAGDGKVVLSDPDGGTVWAVAETPVLLSHRLESIFGIVAQHDDVYVGVARRCDADWPLDPVVRLSAGGTAQVVATVDCPLAMAPMPDGRIAVTDQAVVGGRVLALDSAGQTSELVPNAASSILLGVAVDDAGRVYTSSLGGSVIARWDADGAAASPIVGTNGIGGGPLMVHGSVLFAVDAARGALFRAALEPTPAQAVEQSLPYGVLPWGLAPGTNDTAMILDEASGTILQVSPDAVTHVAHVGAAFPALAANEAGQLSVIDANDRAIRVSP